jgi:hypothetical protein
MVLTVAGWVAASLIALFAEPLRRYWHRIRLDISFDRTPNYVAETPEDRVIGSVRVGPPVKALYFRIGVVNRSSRVANGCRAYLIGVEREEQPGHFVRTLYSDSLQLRWSAMSDGGLGPLDLPPGVRHYVDVISTAEDIGQFLPRLGLTPYRYTEAKLFAQTWTYRFTIQVSGEDVRPAYIQLIYSWTGTWNDRVIWARQFSGKERPKLPS